MPYDPKLDAAVGGLPPAPDDWEGPEDDDWIAAAYEDDRVWKAKP